MKKLIPLLTFCLLCVSLFTQEQITENTLTLQDAIALYEDVNLESKQQDGNTALILAAFLGHTEAVTALIEAGANLDVQDNNGNTALRATTSNEHTEIVSLQKKAGASEYNIGDRGPGGGLIFYIYPESNRYLERSDYLGTANWNDAKTFAKNYRGGGYDDWFWSSSEYRSDGAWLQNFSAGSQIYTYKSYDVSNVCVARAFTP